MLPTLKKKSKKYFLEEGGTAHTLIERSRISTARPRVRNGDLLRGVRDGWWEVTALEERFVEAQAEHVLKTIVDINAPIQLLLLLKCSVSARGGETKARPNLT
jgi:hypothetical protein